VPLEERMYIWGSTGGICYLCKTHLERLSSWHIEHVVAFSENASANDILANMLPSCASCNLRKNSRRLEDVIQQDITFDLDTGAAEVAHLNTAARGTILRALEVKHSRKKQPEKGRKGAKNGPENDTGPTLDAILTELEDKISNQVADNAQMAPLFPDGDTKPGIRSLEIDSRLLKYDLDDHTIGSGAFGEVYLGHLVAEGAVGGGSGSRPSSERVEVDAEGEAPEEAVAIKFPSARRGSLRSLVTELEVLNRVCHPNIVRVLGWFTPRSDHSYYPLGVVLEYCSYCLEKSNVQRNVRLPLLLQQLCSALGCLHANRCIHRDVKPHNILVTKAANQGWEQAQAKLCDFGESKFMDSCGSKRGDNTRGAGTAAFKAPETRNGYLSAASDVYSLGKTLEALLNGGHNIGVNRDRELATALQGLAGRMAMYKPEKRPSLEVISAELELIVKGVNGGAGAGVFAMGDVTEELSAIKATQSSACGEKSKMATPLIAAPVCVVMLVTARRRELPKGARGMKYHSSSACGYISNKVHVEVSLEEAAEFRHTPCSRCSPRADVGALAAERR